MNITCAQKCLEGRCQHPLEHQPDRVSSTTEIATVKGRIKCHRTSTFEVQNVHDSRQSLLNQASEGLKVRRRLQGTPRSIARMRGAFIVGIDQAQIIWSHVWSATRPHSLTSHPQCENVVAAEVLEESQRTAGFWEISQTKPRLNPKSNGEHRGASIMIWKETLSFK